MTTYKIFSKTLLYSFSIFLLSGLLAACTWIPSPLQTSISTHTVVPTILSTASATPSPTLFITETPADTPTSIPSQTLTLAYSNRPTISDKNATAVKNFDQIDGGVNGIAISPNGKYLAAAFNNGVGIVWDISTVKYWGEWEDAPKHIFTAKGSISFNPGSNVLATGGSLIDLPTMKITQELPGTVTFSPNGEKLTLVEWDAVSFWNLNGEQWILDYKQDEKFVASITFSPDGTLLGEALEWGGGEGVNIWRISDHKLLYSFPPSEHGHPAHFNFDAYAYLAFSPDNQFVATGTKDEPAVRIWDLQSGKLVQDLTTVVEMEKGFYVPDVECVAFSQDAKMIAIAAGGTIIFKRISDGEYLGLLEVSPLNWYPGNYITACALSSDGKLLVVGDSGGDVSIWSVPVTVP